MNWVADASAGIPITASRVDAEAVDIGQALTASIANDGQTPILANLPMSTFRHTGVGNGVAATDYAALGQVQAQGFAWGSTSGGAANVQTLTPVPAIVAYAAGQVFRFIWGFTNTGPLTLNINSLGAKAVQLQAAALTGGEAVAGKVGEVVYDGTALQLLSAIATGRGGLIGCQTFTTTGAGTYTATVGTNSIVVELLGGGGGGGGAALTGGAQATSGSGGGGGGYARKRITSGFAGASYTVGAKGTGGAAGNNAGTAGGTTSWGSGPVFQATGGSAGGGSGAFTPPVFGTSVVGGGQGSSGDLNAAGGNALSAVVVSSGGQGGIGGIGGNSIWGQGGFGGTSATGAAGSNGAGKGAGGGGGYNSASQGTGKAGGDGTDGIIIVWEYS